MGEKKKFIPDENQVNLNETTNGYLNKTLDENDIVKNKRINDKVYNETIEGIVVENKDKNIDDKKTNDENENMDYKEKLKEIDELKEQINQLANNLNSLQDDMIISVSKLLDEKLSKMKNNTNENGEEIRKYTKTRSKFDRKTGQMVVYAEELTQDTDETNQENEKRSNYIYNVGSVQNIENKDEKQMIDELAIVNSKPDMVIHTKDENGKNRDIIVEAKMLRDNGKYNIKKKELPFNESKSFAIGAALGTGILPGIGTAIGAILGGLTGVVGNKVVDNNYIKEAISENLKKTLTDPIREFLVSNPVTSYAEFIERIKDFGLDITVEEIELIGDTNTSDYYNKVILETYDNMKAIELYKIAKGINDNNVDYTSYRGKNLLGEYMKNKGITQVWLSEKTGIAKSTIASMVSNKDSMPTVDKALKIAKVLQIDIEQIFPLVNEE